MASEAAEPVENVVENDDDDDDDMANLFSFGSDDGESASQQDDSQHSSSNGLGTTTAAAATKSSPNKSRSTSRQEAQNGSGSPDSFLELLSAETSGVVLQSGEGAAPHDQETQDILDWLDNDESQTEQIVFDTSDMPSSILETPPPPPEPEPEATVVELPPTFDTFAEALASSESTKEQIRALFVKEQQEKGEGGNSGVFENEKQQRAELYCRMVCHKSVQDTAASSLADSFEQWRTNKNLEETDSVQDEYAKWILSQPQNLAQRIAEQTGRSVTDCETELIDLVLYHQHQTQIKHTNSSAFENDNDANNNNGEGKKESGAPSEKDVLLPAIVTVILSAGIPVNAAAVVLSQIIPNFMPLLALPVAESWEAALALHSEFYLLACYHIPLLVFHLDRYLPGWHWPKIQEHESSSSAVSIGRNLKKQGLVPPSWLVSHLAGECGGTMLPTSTVLMLWDGILTDQNNATRFFLTLAVLEQHAASLLLLTDEELVTALENVWTLVDVEKNKEPEDKDWLHEWWPHARSLQSSTPESVLNRLKLAEDEAVQQALLRRQQRKEAALQARLEAEAEANRIAQEKKADEARQRLSRARLVAFYRKHAPGKESNIDQIMDIYAGRLDVLDAKLKSKYGESFNPALKAKPPKPPNKLLAGFGRRKSETEEDEEAESAQERKVDTVSVMVTAAEVLPVVCWSKEATAARGVEQRRRSSSNIHHQQKQLKFYLVDSRSEQAAQEQGRFPTAVSLGPEAMMDPERLQQNEEMFESLRGAVHIVIMGEGFNALPSLYNQKLSPKLEELMQQDESRTDLCSLWFIKKGFPFVSVLDGGFAAAHSWLVREGPEHHLDASSVLIDYNPDASLFGQLEKLHNASATEKAQRKMANLLESSMVTMTRRAQQLERIAADLDTKEGRQGLRLNLFRRSESVESGSLDNSKRDKSYATAEQAVQELTEPLSSSLSLQEENAPTTAEAEAPPPPPLLPPSSAKTSSPTNTISFKGIGAAFNSSMKQASTGAAGGNLPRRNPFARFGREPPSESARSGGFGGFNQLRQATLSRMRSGATEANDGTVSNTSVSDAPSPKGQVKKV